MKNVSITSGPGFMMYFFYLGNYLANEERVGCMAYCI